MQIYICKVVPPRWSTFWGFFLRTPLGIVVRVTQSSISEDFSALMQARSSARHDLVNERLRCHGSRRISLATPLILLKLNINPFFYDKCTAFYGSALLIRVSEKGGSLWLFFVCVGCYKSIIRMISIHDIKERSLIKRILHHHPLSYVTVSPPIYQFPFEGLLTKMERNHRRW